jgi:cell division protein FtsL
MNDKINELNNKIDNQDKIINEQALEIAKLKLKKQR